MKLPPSPCARPYRLLLAGLLLVQAPLALAAQAAESPLGAITEGHALLGLRARYENVEQDGKTADANATTLRSLFGWQTAAYRGLSLTVEGINVGHLGAANYNDTLNGRTTLPTVADPDYTGLNQLYAEYAGLEDTVLRLGKQVIRLDNLRFVGNVDFRQTMQTFSGLTLTNRSVPILELFGAHLWRLTNVFTQQQQIRAELAHADWTWKPGNHLEGYGYFLDQAKTVSATGFANNANATLGLRADGAWPLDETWSALYTAEAPHQSAYSGGDSRIGATYERLGGGARLGQYSARVDFERKGSNRGLYGFQTPLATNHLFQGWADQFLTTPAQGLRDTYLTLGAPVAGVSLTAEYHRFSADYGSVKFGHEFDAGATAPLPWLKGLVTKLEYARFSEGDPLTPATARKRDTQRIWLTLIYNLP